MPFTLVHAGKYSTEDQLKTQTIHKLNTTKKQTKQNTAKQSYPTTLVQSPFMTLGHETRWAYCTTLLSPHGANWERHDTNRPSCSWASTRRDSDGGRLSSSDDGSSALKHDITKNTHILQLNKCITLCAAKPDLEANQASIDSTKALKSKTQTISVKQVIFPSFWLLGIIGKWVSDLSRF